MNKPGIGVVVAIVILLVGVSPAQAWWHGPNVWIGGPVWYPYPYYPPPVVVQPSAPIIVQPSPPESYVQQPDRAHEPYWYYCQGANEYYPYVKECPGGWMHVPPHPVQP